MSSETDENSVRVWKLSDSDTGKLWLSILYQMFLSCYINLISICKIP